MDRVNLLELGDIQDKYNYLSSYIHNDTLDIEFLYVSDFRSAKILRDFVDVICRSFHIDSITLSRFILIVDEMNNNAIEHGSRKGDMNKLRFKIFIEEGMQNVQIEVEDSGK
jgi:anti-sigma regulatory factor (Ser/Thr protein kinase)